MSAKKGMTLKGVSSRTDRRQKPYTPSSRIFDRNNSCMVNVNTVEMNSYIIGLNDISAQQAYDEYFTKTRVQELNSQRVVTRSSNVGEKMRWYTTTCYLSSKMIIILFSMLSAFSLYPTTSICKFKTSATLLWLRLEKTIWNTLTTNSINYRSEPATFEMLGQETHESLRDFLQEGPLENIRDIIIGNTSPVSRGTTLNSQPIENLFELQELFHIKRGEMNNLSCGNIIKNFPMLGAISVKKDINGHPITEGIIHWFVFVQSDDNQIYLYTSWADNTIESVMDKVDINIDEFNHMLGSFHSGTTQTTETIEQIRKYFFTRPLGSRMKQLTNTEVDTYLEDTFVGSNREAPIIEDRFSIIVYPDYYKSCYDILSSTIEYINSSDEIKEQIMLPIETSIKVYRNLNIPDNIEKFKLQLTYLYTVLGCSESIFYDENILITHSRGGRRKSRKMKRMRGIRKTRKGIKRVKRTKRIRKRM